MIPADRHQSEDTVATAVHMNREVRGQRTLAGASLARRKGEYIHGVRPKAICKNVRYATLIRTRAIWRLVGPQSDPSARYLPLEQNKGAPARTQAF